MATKRNNTDGEQSDMKKARTEGDESLQQIRMLIDNWEASVIIGKGGANVKQIRTESKAFLSILRNEGGAKERVLQVTGPVEYNVAAFKMIGELLLREDTARKTKNGEGESTETWPFKLLIHKSLAGAIIGKGGEIIRAMQTETGAKVSISTQPLGASTEKSVTVTGTVAQLNDVVTRILTQLWENPLKPGAQTALYVPGQMAPGAFTGPPAGYGAPPGAYGAYGAPPPGAYGAPPMMQHMGHAPPMGGGMGGGGGAQKTQKIVIPTVCAGTVIGKAGSIINEIKGQSQTQISISPPDPPTSDDRVITITGSEQGIQTAIHLIRQRVESFQAQPAGY